IMYHRQPMPDGGCVTTHTDITERKRTEDALREARDTLESKVSERTRDLTDINRKLQSETAERKEISTALEEAEMRQRLLLESTNVIPWEADAKTWKFTYVGPQAVEFFGYPTELWLEKDFWVEHIHPEDRDWVVDYCQKSTLQSDHYEMDYRIIKADGGTIWIQDIVNVVRQGGEPVALRGFMIDITERKSLEELQRNISGWLISAQEEERRKISRELHDDFSQRLALLAVEIHQIGQEISESKLPSAKSMDELWSQTQELAADLHRLSHQLHPAILDQLGLGTAVRSLCREFTDQHDILVKYTEHEIPESVSPDVAVCVYRAVQEGLRNIVKHSGAKDAEVQLTGDRDTIHLRIADQGVGFDPKTTGKKGLGLISIEERTRLVQGELSLQSRPSHGTCIDLKIPTGAHQDA
ncbi:MAG: PAS domain S-box protein, partial [Deltaproteobacteria bacterium]|nr:PAS domain S-box protein [Deltaproteobacteria bacterium]